jgi:hypothetical protein
LVGGYLGIDESNHGRFPEIFVGAYSKNRKLLKEIGGLTKVRKKGEKDFIKSKDYKYVLIPKEYTKLLHPGDLALVAMTELIKSYDGLEKVLIDGQMGDKRLEKLEKTIYPLTPKIIAIPKGDSTCPIINTADHIAHILYTKYTNKRITKQSKLFLKHLITPKIEDYVSMFEQS